MPGVDFHYRVTALVIGISHSAEYLWWGQLKPHSIKQRLLLTVVKGSSNPAESVILWALKGFCSSAAERMPYKLCYPGSTPGRTTRGGVRLKIFKNL